MKATVTVPENLNEISLKQYQRFLLASENIDKDILEQKMVSIFCSIPFKDVALIKQKDIREISDHLNALFVEEQQLQQTFKIKNVEFGFIPSLEDITAGEFSDLDSYMGDWNNMHKAMAVLFRPITTKIKDKYLIEDYEGSDKFAGIMEFAPLGAVMGAVVFFYHLSKELSRATQAYLAEEMLEETIQQVRSSHKSGDGMEAFTHSQEETLRELMRLQSTH